MSHPFVSYDVFILSQYNTMMFFLSEKLSLKGYNTMMFFLSEKLSVFFSN